MNILIYQNGKQIEKFKNVEYMTDCYAQRVYLETWADYMNYINTDGRRTCGNGDYYYDTWEEVAVDMNKTVADVIATFPKHLVAEACDGYIVEEEEEEE